MLAKPFKLKPCIAAELQTLDSVKGTPSGSEAAVSARAEQPKINSQPRSLEQPPLPN